MRIDQYIMSIERANMRSFSSQQPRKDFSSEEKSKGSQNAYEDEFADLLNQGKVSEKQKTEFEARRKDKAEKVAADQ